MAEEGKRSKTSGPPGQPDLVETTVVDGGLTVVTEYMPDVLSVSLGFWVGTGSVDEPEPIAGASHFLEHLLFKGTDQRSAREIADAVDAVGGDINAFTTKEHTAFYVRLLAESVDLGLDILSEIIWSPALRSDELEAERQVILEEILMHADEPAEEVHDLFNAALYPGHPLGRDVLGLEATVRSMSRPQVADFHREHYRARNVIVTAAGRVDHAKISEGVERRLEKVAANLGRDVLIGGAPPSRTAPSGQAERRMIINRPTEQAHIMIGMQGFARDHPDRQVLNVLDHILGGGMSSRLFQSVREERGLAYSVYSYRSGYQGAGDLAVYAGTAPSRATDVVAVLTEELDKMAATGVSEEELRAAKSHIRGATALGLEDSGARMSRLGRSQLTHGRVPSLAELEAEVAAVTTADIARVAAQVLGSPRTLVVLGPFADDAFASWDGGTGGPARGEDN
ncbi:MAG TPA: pitrilysin family protein [Acidimicrobiales bacterium]|nr:pitrilysin family protein [Acidimicrobiales bacterium]